MATKRRKLIVVSNRGPFRKEGGKRWVRAAGGLVTALHPVLQKRGGVWISSKPARDFDSVTIDAPDLAYELAHVALSKAQRAGFYEGVSNAVLWPLLHGFEPTIQVGEASWSSYVSANEQFTAAVLGASASRDLIWVQDYHLMLVPGMIRSQRPRARIGWFCHIPWPPPDTFGLLPWGEELLEGLLGADIIGFHLPEYAMHFQHCVERFTRHGVVPEGVRYEDRVVRTITAPVGIPVQELQSLAVDPDVGRKSELIRQLTGNRQLLLGVDRLDYTKGIPERLAAFERLLQKDRAARSRYALVQIMVPSRTDVKAYADLKKEIDQMVGDINGRYASIGRVPVHYLYRNLNRHDLFAHYRAADVALVTPLRDGMNLVAHEYAAARADERGVLVLSEFAGAAKYLDGAVLVNPYDIEATTAAIHRALAMKPNERRNRMRRLRAEVMRLDVHGWADAYLSALEEP